MTTREALDRDMRQVLAQLELISAIPAAQPATSAGSEHPGGRRPPGDHGHTRFARWYGPPFHHCEPSCDHVPPARNDQEREDCLAVARDELQHLRRGTPVDPATLETAQDARDRMLRETVGSTPEQIEQSSWPYTRFQVRRYRIAAGRDTEIGELIEDQAGDDVDPRAWALQLRERGLSVRAIALTVGKHPTQIQRYLGKAA